MAESVAPATDPLNLMRIMPSKGARVRLPDWQLSHARPRMAFCLTTNGHESTRMIFEPDICAPLFVIPSEVEGSLDISVHL
jgi:hypothetical protein